MGGVGGGGGGMRGSQRLCAGALQVLFHEGAEQGDPLSVLSSTECPLVH